MTQIENGTFRVTRWELESGDVIPAHGHEREYVVVLLTEGTLWATAPDGTETAIELTIGQSSKATPRPQAPRTLWKPGDRLDHVRRNREALVAPVLHPVPHRPECVP